MLKEHSSTKGEETPPKMEDGFIEWFVGICDAESNFLIRVRKDNKGNTIGFEFIFRIAPIYFNKPKLSKKISHKLSISCNYIVPVLEIRDLHTRISSKSANENRDNKLYSEINPYYITGFTDAEGCFSVLYRRNKKLKIGWRLEVSFQIHLHKKDRELLKRIRAALGGVGEVYDSGSKGVLYIVRSPLDLASAIIPHFEKYPLITKKREDFELFKQVVHIINNKEHLTHEGFERVLSIKASMRNGLTEILAETFPNTVPVATPIIETPKSLDPNWIVGFTDGDGSFLVHVQNVPSSKLGKTVKLQFKITQDERDIEVLKLILLYLNCGTLRTSDGSCKIVTVTKFADIINIIIPFFQKYPIQGIKRLDFTDFVKVAELINNKQHLTKEGLDQILLIKSGMNTGRDHASHS